MKSLPNYFEKLEKQYFPQKNTMKNENKAVFKKPNQIILGATLEILNWTDLIEKEMRFYLYYNLYLIILFLKKFSNLFSKKYYIKIFIQKFSLETLENLNKEYQSIVGKEFFSPLLEYVF